MLIEWCTSFYPNLIQITRIVQQFIDGKDIGIVYFMRSIDTNILGNDAIYIASDDVLLFYLVF
jgi:hypothetical protein